MKKVLWALALFLGLAAAWAGESPAPVLNETFDSLSPDRWQAVLNLSPKQGTAAAKNGELCLKSRWKEPCEVEVNSRFLLSGDFSVSAAYSSGPGQEDCRTNAGIVVETANGGVSYKCYVSTAPGAGRFFRARLDRNGVSADEVERGGAAPAEGEIRITREKGKVAFFRKGEKGWEKVHEFAGECVNPLAIRIKLATGGTVAEYRQACPAAFCLSELTVEKAERLADR